MKTLHSPFFQLGHTLWLACLLFALSLSISSCDDDSLDGLAPTSEFLQTYDLWTIGDIDTNDATKFVIYHFDNTSAWRCTFDSERETYSSALQSNKTVYVSYTIKDDKITFTDKAGSTVTVKAYFKRLGSNLYLYLNGKMYARPEMTGMDTHMYN
mgnify:CR=1 FL=1